MAFVLLALSALLTRAALYSLASINLWATNSSRAKLLAVYGAIWLLFAAFFFAFVVLRQFVMMR